MTDYKPGDAILRHGYTLSDLDQLARRSVARYRRWGVTRSLAGMYDTARSAVVEALYAAVEPPSEHDLVVAGAKGIEVEMRADLSAHGRRVDATKVGAMFAAYWHGHTTTHFPDDAIVERLALVEILPLLTHRQCEVLVTFAATGSQPATAEALGITATAVSTHLNAARRTCREWWHEGETPIVHRDPETCHNGHPRTPENRHGTGCRVCENEAKRLKRRLTKITEVAA